MKNIFLLVTLLISTCSIYSQDTETNKGPFRFESVSVIKVDATSEKNPVPRCKIYVVYENKKVFLAEGTDEEVHSAWTKPNTKKNQLASAMVFWAGGGEEYMLSYANDAIKVHRQYVGDGEGEVSFELMKTIPISVFTKDTAKAIEAINKHLKGGKV